MGRAARAHQIANASNVLQPYIDLEYCPPFLSFPSSSFPPSTYCHSLSSLYLLSLTFLPLLTVTLCDPTSGDPLPREPPRVTLEPTRILQVILSLENHLSLPQQRVAAAIFVETLGDLLEVPPSDEDRGATALPSPSQLMKKVLRGVTPPASPRCTPQAY